jgi:tripartite-type tricarboxylate transporter receptor subunit TctC
MTRWMWMAMALASFVAGPAIAQEWPSKPIKLVVPYPPGGNVDSAARIVAAELQKELKQTVIVENKAGAGGLLAGESVAKADADGYTLFLPANGPLLYSPVIYNRPLYHWQKSFVPITSISFTPLVIQVHPSVQAKTATELIALVSGRGHDESPAQRNAAAPDRREVDDDSLQGQRTRDQ